MSPNLVTFFLSRWAKTPHLLRCDPRLGDFWLNAFKRNKCNNYNLVTKDVGYCFHITFHHSSPRSVCCCFIIPRWTGRSCALPVPRPALRPVACCPSQLSRPPLSRSGAALTSSSSSFWGFTPGRADHWTHGGGSEDYCHASERAWSWGVGLVKKHKWQRDREEPSVGWKYELRCRAVPITHGDALSKWD